MAIGEQEECAVSLVIADGTQKSSHLILGEEVNLLDVTFSFCWHISLSVLVWEKLFVREGELC